MGLSVQATYEQREEARCAILSFPHHSLLSARVSQAQLATALRECHSGSTEQAGLLGKAGADRSKD